MGITFANTKLALYDRRYNVNGYSGSYRFTAEELRGQIQKDAQASPFGWIASAPELWNVISRHDFPYGVRDEIAALIVDCFAGLEDPHYNSHRDPSELEAVSNCYNVLPLDHPARQNYLRALIAREIRLSYSTDADSDIDVMFLYSGKRHSIYEADYTKQALAEIRERELAGEKIDFTKLRRNVRWEYARSYQKARKSGVFEGDVKANYDLLLHGRES